jgi:KDO2-lipid IV(A) lauroyltransferase
VLARRSFLHLGTTLGEALYLLRQPASEIGKRVRVEGWEHVERARAAGHPVLVVTGHCGNWELLAATINSRGLGMAVVARQLDEPQLDMLLVGLRARFGTPTIARGTPGAARALLRAIREGGALGMLIDQDTKVEGVFSFLGQPGVDRRRRRAGAALSLRVIRPRSSGLPTARTCASRRD